MRALRTLKAKICAYAIVFLASFGLGANPLLAGSSDFTGIYGAVHASLNGVSMAGSHISRAGDVSKGTGGALVPLGGLEVGVNLPIGPVLFITLGTTFVGGDGARIFETKDADDNADVSVDADNYSTVFIQPSLSLWDNTAIFVKLGMVHADLTAYGDIQSQPDNLSGTVYGIGTQTMTNAGLFMRTEAGAMVFDHFKMSGVGAGGAANTSTANNGDRTVEGDPLAAYGKVTIGFKF